LKPIARAASASPSSLAAKQSVPSLLAMFGCLIEEDVVRPRLICSPVARPVAAYFQMLYVSCG
uniref:Uncharacterized protein n=1 Tax=Aegilops tauschii subsp. strangulata TaxID=200361 RepID=A0A453BFM1_AEGTS